jgi:hypothetical protein
MRCHFHLDLDAKSLNGRPYASIRFLLSTLRPSPPIRLSFVFHPRALQPNRIHHPASQHSTLKNHHFDDHYRPLSRVTTENFSKKIIISQHPLRPAALS